MHEKAQSETEDTKAIRTLFESWTAAVRRRDIDAILRNHSSDMVMFDLPPPLQSRGIDAYKKTWDLFFSWARDPVLFDVIEMQITAGKEVAFIAATMRCAGLKPDRQPEELEFRLTVGLRKIEGRWAIAHEHHSVPAVD